MRGCSLFFLSEDLSDDLSEGRIILLPTPRPPVGVVDLARGTTPCSSASFKDSEYVGGGSFLPLKFLSGTEISTSLSLLLPIPWTSTSLSLLLLSYGGGDGMTLSYGGGAEELELDTM